jgi:hypothetical protein
MESIPDEEVDSEVLLAQGDELLRASRRLIEMLDIRIQGDEPGDADPGPIKR